MQGESHAFSRSAQAFGGDGVQFGEYAGGAAHAGQFGGYCGISVQRGNSVGAKLLAILCMAPVIPQGGAKPECAQVRTMRPSDGVLPDIMEKQDDR